MPQRRVHGPERKRKNWGVQAEGLSGEWRVAAAVSLMDPSGLHTATVRRGQSAGAGRRSVPGPAGLLPTPPARLSRFVVRACLRALSRKPPPNRTASATAQGPLQVQGLTKSAHPGAEGGSTPQALPNFNEEIQEKSSRQGVSRSASSPTAQLGVGPPHTSCRNEVTPAGDASVWSEERQVFRVTLRTLPPPPGSLPSCGPLSSALPPPQGWPRPPHPPAPILPPATDPMARPPPPLPKEKGHPRDGWNAVWYSKVEAITPIRNERVGPVLFLQCCCAGDGGFWVYGGCIFLRGWCGSFLRIFLKVSHPHLILKLWNKEAPENCRWNCCKHSYPMLVFSGAP